MEDRETARMRKYGESKTTRIMMATVPHVTSSLGLRKFQTVGFLLTRVYIAPFSPIQATCTLYTILNFITSYTLLLCFCTVHCKIRSRESSFGIATRYELDGPGIESRRGRDFSLLSRPTLRPTQSPIQRVPGLSRG